MTKVSINYEVSKIQTIVNSVKEYNEMPQDRRGDIRDVIETLNNDEDTIGTLLALEDDRTEDSDEDYTEYILTVVPVWCRDYDTYDNADEKSIQEMFDDYCDDLDDEYKKPKDCWHSDLEVAVLEHDWTDMTSQVLTLQDFVKYMSDCLKSDLAENL